MAELDRSELAAAYLLLMLGEDEEALLPVGPSSTLITGLLHPPSAEVVAVQAQAIVADGTLASLSGQASVVNLEELSIAGTLQTISASIDVLDKDGIAIVGAMPSLSTSVVISNPSQLVSVTAALANLSAEFDATNISPLTVDYLIVGNGGATANAPTPGTQASGGAGAGEYVAVDAAVLSSGTYPIVIGAVATPGGSIGGNNTFNGKTAKAGGNGVAGAGQSGGSGAGGGFNSAHTAQGAGSSTAVDGIGHNGASATQAGSSSGGGGGASAAGSGTTGGAGMMWHDGVTYSKGGNGRSNSPGNGSVGVNPGDGASGAMSTQSSSSPGVGAAGRVGVVKIRYLGTSAIASGGTISIPGDGYVYHTFTASGNFVVP